MWMTTLRITPASSPAGCLSSPARWSRSQADRSERVVEVDDQAHSTARNPHANADPVVGRVHEVHVMAAVVGPLALEIEMRAEDRGIRVARPTAEILGPPVAGVARGPKAVARIAADEVAAQVVDRELPRVRPRDVRRDAGRELERSHAPAAGAAAGAGRGDPAASPRAVHELQVVGLDGSPRSAAHGTAARRAAAGRGSRSAARSA